jgi:hypothetical protein
VDDIEVWYNRVVIHTVCDHSRDYRFGINGQERDSEISGTGNSYTAEYWQYDSRLGRRWNVDPVVKPWESGYATFNNTPISKVDKDGDNPIGAIIGAVGGTVKEVVGQTITNGLKNINEGKGFFKDWGKNMDWADVAIGAGEGALAGTTMGLSLVATSAVSSSLKGAVDFKHDEKKQGLSFSLVGVNKDWDIAIKDATANFAGSMIGLGMGTGVLGDGLAGAAFKGTSSTIGRIGAGAFSGLIQGSFEGLWQYGVNELADYVHGVYRDHYPKTIQLSEVTIQAKKSNKSAHGIHIPNEEQEELKHQWPEMQPKETYE